MINKTWMWSGLGKDAVVLVGDPNAGSETLFNGNYINSARNTAVAPFAMYAGADWPENSPSGGSTSNWAPFKITKVGGVYGKHICIGTGPVGSNAVTGDWSGQLGHLYVWVRDADTKDANNNTVLNYSWHEVDLSKLPYLS